MQMEDKSVGAPRHIQKSYIRFRQQKYVSLDTSADVLVKRQAYVQDCGTVLTARTEWKASAHIMQQSQNAAIVTTLSNEMLSFFVGKSSKPNDAWELQK